MTAGRQHGDDDVSIRHRLGDRSRLRAAGSLQVIGIGVDNIEAGNTMARLDQIDRHGAAHVP